MLNPRLPRGAIARRKTDVLSNVLSARLGFVSAIGLAVVFAATGPPIAHAAGREGPSIALLAAVSPNASASTRRALVEASRWLGSGNPTPFREAWCRDFVNFVLERSGVSLVDRSHLALRALRLGPRVAEPLPGDLVVMRGHVAFFAGWDGAGGLLALGGNQRHRVTLTRFRRRAVIAFVRAA